MRFIEEKLAAGTWSWEVRGAQMRWSSGMYALLGLNRNEVEPSYQLIESMLHPEDLRRPGEALELLQDGLPFERDFRVIRPDGRVRWIANRGEPILNDAGAPVRAIGVMTDVTGAHDKRKALDRAEAYYRALIQATQSLVWTANSKGEVTDMPGLREYLGGRPEQFLGTRWHNMVHPQDRETTIEDWTAAVQSGSEFKRDLRVRAPDGSYRWVRAHAVPIRDAEGNIREYVGVAIDVQREKTLPRSDPASGRLLTGAQVRAARAILHWSVRDLSEAADVSIAAIRRIEENDTFLESASQALARIEDALSAAGVEFYFPVEGKPAVAPA